MNKVAKNGGGGVMGHRLGGRIPKPLIWKLHLSGMGGGRKMGISPKS